MVTLHDLIWVQQPELADQRRWHRWVKGSLGNLGIRHALNAADHVVAISHSTRQAAIRRLGLVSRGDHHHPPRRRPGLGLSARVRFLGALSDVEVQAAYAHAELFAMPSLVEGFGMPVLEAMAAGCPVLTSRGTATAEIADGCAELVDPVYRGLSVTDPEVIEGSPAKVVSPHG